MANQFYKMDISKWHDRTSTERIMLHLLDNCSFSLSNDWLSKTTGFTVKNIKKVLKQLQDDCIIEIIYDGNPHNQKTKRTIKITNHSTNTNCPPQ